MRQIPRIKADGAKATFCRYRPEMMNRHLPVSRPNRLSTLRSIGFRFEESGEEDLLPARTSSLAEWLAAGGATETKRDEGRGHATGIRGGSGLSGWIDFAHESGLLLGLVLKGNVCAKGGASTDFHLPQSQGKPYRLPVLCFAQAMRGGVNALRCLHKGCKSRK